VSQTQHKEVTILGRKSDNCGEEHETKQAIVIEVCEN
jgi:hypothetical protein